MNAVFQDAVFKRGRRLAESGIYQRDTFKRGKRLAERRSIAEIPFFSFAFLHGSSGCKAFRRLNLNLAQR